MFKRFTLIFVTAVLFVTILPAQTIAQDTERDDMIAVWERFSTELWSNWDFDVADDIFTDDFVMHSWGYPDIDKEAYLTNWVGFSSNVFEDYSMMNSFKLVDGEYLALDDTWGGIFAGAFGDIEPTNEEIRVNGFQLLRFEDGKIAELWILYDRTPMMLQMGMMPSEEEVSPDEPWDVAMDLEVDAAEENLALIQEFMGYINDHDLETAFAMYHEDAVIHDLAGVTFTPESATAMLTEVQGAWEDHGGYNPLFLAEGNLTVTLYDLTFVEGEVAAGAVHVDRWDDGKIAESWWFYDGFSLNQQIMEYMSTDS